MAEDLHANLYGTAPGFVDLFGPERIRNMPISEETMTGVAAGAAMCGLRPILDLTYASFMYLAMDQLVNQVAKNRFMFGGQARMPVVYRAAMFYRNSTAAHHSDRPYSMFMNVPGLKIVCPTTPADIKGLLRSAIDSDDPVLCFEDATLWLRKGEIPEGEYRVPLGKARVVREGTDVTVVAIAGAVHEAARAAEAVKGEDGLDVELIDPRTLVPLDIDAIFESVDKTGRLVIVDPAHNTCSAASHIAALVCEERFESLRGPVRRVTTPDTQVPFAPALELTMYPTAARIASAVREVCGAGSALVAPWSGRRG